jgi:zinc protease
VAQPPLVTPEQIVADATALGADRRSADGLPTIPLSAEVKRVHPFGAPTAVNPQGLRVLSFTLPNGLDVLLLEDHSAPIVAYQTWFSVGSRHEEEGKTGIAHLFEHLMFKATKSLADGEFDRILESHGAETNAATWLDWTMYREQVPSSALALVVGLEADRMSNLLLTADQLAREREVVKSERRYRVDDDPEGTMFELLYATAFTRHPYHWPTIGWMEDIEGITLADCQKFYRDWYSPNNATVVIVGDFDPAVALGLVMASYGAMEARAVPVRNLEAEPTQVAERRRTVVMPITSPKLLFGYRVPEVTHEDHAAVQVAHQILFGGDSGRLYKRLVVETELATEASGWVGEFSEPGLYEVLVTLRPGADPDRVELIVQEELDGLAEADLAEAQLEGAKNQLEILYLRNMQSAGDRAYGLGHYATTAGDFAHLFEVSGRYRAVEAEDVRRVAARYFTRARRTIITAVVLE